MAASRAHRVGLRRVSGPTSPLAQEPLCSTQPEPLYMVALTGDHAHLHPRRPFLSVLNLHSREESALGFLHGMKRDIPHLIAL